MKKARIAVVALAVLMLFAAVSCKDEPVHQHVFDQKVAEEKYLAEKATEESLAKYYLSCECGEKGEETFEYGKKLDHVFGKWEESKKATCTEAGEKTRKCTHEGCTEVQTEKIEALGHKFGDWTEKTVATCTLAAVESRECATCHTEETRDGKAALGHSLDGEGKCVVCGEEGLFAAKIGENNFKSLAAAIESITDDSVTTIITMVNNVGEANGISVSSGKNIVVDFDGHEYYVKAPGEGSSGTQTQAFQLLKDSKIVFKNGTIGCDESCKDDQSVRAIMMVIQNYCNLTLDNMVVDGTNMSLYGSPTGYTVSVNCGNVVFKDTRIIAPKGYIAFDSCYSKAYTRPTVVVTGSSVMDGTVELSGGNLSYLDGVLSEDQIKVYTGFKYDVTSEVSEGVKWTNMVAK